MAFAGVRRPMKILSLAWSVVWWLALAGAALAGPTTTTTDPNATTTTTTTDPNATTTTTTTLTATTAPPTTTTTTTTSTTTTTQPQPGDLSGLYAFADRSTGDANTSLMNVDTSLGQVCLAGQVQEVDESSNPPATVTFTYSSIGDITKDSAKKVQADFVTVSLTLDISGPVPAYNETITANCQLKGTLRSAGERDKVKLLCELGEDFSTFPVLTSDQVTSIVNAYTRVKRAKATSKRGKLKIDNFGVPSAGVPYTCPLP